MKKLLVITVVIAMLASIFVGCTTQTPTTSTAPSVAASTEPSTAPTEAEKTFTIGYSVKTLSDPYMQLLANAIQDQVKKYPNMKLEIADAKADLNTQLNQAEDLITKGVDVLLFCPQDADACGPIVDKAVAAGIPVVEVCTVTNNTNYTSFVGSDDVDAGKMLGNYVMDQLKAAGKTTGKFAVIEGIMGQSSQVKRLEGLKQTIMADGSGYECVAIQTGNWQRDQAMSITEDWLTKYSDLDAVICENDDMAMGALQAAESAGRKENIIILGVDGIADALQAVKDGRENASILQDADGQGRKAIDVCQDIVMGKTVDKSYMIPFVQITTENVDQFLK